MTTAVVVMAGLAAGTYALKSAGPLVLGGRQLPRWLDSVAGRIPAALLAALVVVSAVADDRELVFDARVAGVVAAGVALRLRLPMAVAVLAAVAATALVRGVS